VGPGSTVASTGGFEIDPVDFEAGSSSDLSSSEGAVEVVDVDAFAIGAGGEVVEVWGVGFAVGGRVVAVGSAGGRLPSFRSTDLSWPGASSEGELFLGRIVPSRAEK
jgi:hypothetical protein